MVDHSIINLYLLDPRAQLACFNFPATPFNKLAKKACLIDHRLLILVTILYFANCSYIKPLSLASYLPTIGKKSGESIKVKIGLMKTESSQSEMIKVPRVYKNTHPIHAPIVGYPIILTIKNLHTTFRRAQVTSQYV